MNLSRLFVTLKGLSRRIILFLKDNWVLVIGLIYVTVFWMGVYMGIRWIIRRFAI